MFIKDSRPLLFVFRCVAVLVVFFGAQASFGMVWNLADVLMGLMAIVNIVAILLLGNVAVKTLDDYSRQKKEGENPVFQPEKLGIHHTECWGSPDRKEE